MLVKKSMKNPNAKKKIRAVLRAALYGVITSLALSFYTRNYFHGKNDIAWDMILMIPSVILSNVLGLERTPEGRAVSNSFAFLVLANALAITLAFVICAFLWQFIVKGNHEDKN